MIFWVYILDTTTRNMSATSAERQAVLGSFVLRLFPQVMQWIIKEYITSRGLTEKYKQKDIRAALTASEIALMDKLPDMVDFTIELCYKILRYEHLLPEPKCKWGNVPSDEDVEITDDIQRILNRTNEIIRMMSDDFSEDYYEEVCTTTHDVLKRVDKFLNMNTCAELYHTICQSKLNPTDIVSKLRAVKQVNVTHNIHEVDENKEHYSRISLVVIESFPNMLRTVIKLVKTARDMYNMCKPFMEDFTSHQQTKLQELNSSNSYDSLDISMIYRLLKQFSLIKSPTNNWGGVPGEKDTEVADDVERIRYFRNKIAHMCSTNIGKVEFDNYFNQFLDIGRRMDKNFQNTNFESDIIVHKTCNMDTQMQIKYMNLLKELENIKLRYEKKPIKFFWGDSFQRSLENLRSLLQNEKLEGREKIRIQIIFENQSDGEKNTNILNAIKDEINEGLSGIEFISATQGSLIVNVDVLLEMMKTDEYLQSTIASLVEKISEHITLSTTERIDIILSHTEEFSTWTTTLESANPIYLDFNIEARLLKTDDQLREHLSKLYETISKNGKGMTTHSDISARLLPINLGYQGYQQQSYQQGGANPYGSWPATTQPGHPSAGGQPGRPGQPPSIEAPYDEGYRQSRAGLLSSLAFSAPGGQAPHPTSPQTGAPPRHYGDYSSPQPGKPASAPGAPGYSSYGSYGGQAPEADHYGQPQPGSQPLHVSAPGASFTQAQAAVGDDIPVSATFRKHVDIKSKENKSQDIKDCIKIGNMLLFTEQDKNQLIIYNADGTLERTFHLDYKPWFLTEINRNTVAVSCTSAKTVLIINIDTGSVNDKIRTKDFCFGISYNDYLYVMVGSSNKKSLLCVMDLAGKVIRTLESVHSCHITVHKNMLVCIEDNKLIRCFSLDGKVIWEFQEDIYKRLRRVTTDNEGNVYVTNEDTNVVLVVSKDGKQCKEILTESDGMDMPAGIHFDKNENILMICSDRDAWLFDIIKNKK
ncbi:uncharacterized protein LOC143072293 isoform X2 [Mytilus galloprovincialis]|uniref:uncharacterized protein LOC143072293 isoform X2 n=1 Tax=Mytilus galloprovincialis TaxID=29158 RepID=UPI003F7C58C0